MAVDNDELELALRCAVTCAILAPAGEGASNHGFSVWHLVKNCKMFLHPCGRCTAECAILPPAGERRLHAGRVLVRCYTLRRKGRNRHRVKVGNGSLGNQSVC